MKVKSADSDIILSLDMDQSAKGSCLLKSKKLGEQVPSPGPFPAASPRVFASPTGKKQHPTPISCTGFLWLLLWVLQLLSVSTYLPCMPWQKSTDLLGNFVLRLLQVLAERPLFLHTVLPEGIGSHTVPSTSTSTSDVIKGSSVFNLGVLEFQNEETKASRIG